MKITMFAAAELTDAGKKSLLGDYVRWVNLHFMRDQTVIEEEASMRAEFEDIMSLSPKLLIDKYGNLAVQGLVDPMKPGEFARPKGSAKKPKR